MANHATTDVFTEHGLVDSELESSPFASSSAVAASSVGVASSSRTASVEWIGGRATMQQRKAYPLLDGVSVEEGKQVRFFYCPSTDPSVQKRFRRQAQIRALDTLPPDRLQDNGRSAAQTSVSDGDGPRRGPRGCRPPATILAWWEGPDGLWCVLDAEQGEEQDLIDAWHQLLGDDWPEEQLRAADAPGRGNQPSKAKREKWANVCDLLVSVVNVLQALEDRHLSLNWAHPSCFFVRPRTDDEIAAGKKPDTYIRRLWGVRPVIDFDLAKILDGSPLASSSLFATDPPDQSWGQLTEDYVFRHLRYLAPETVISRRSTRTNDLYSWGVLAWELMTGTTVDGRPDSIDLADVDALVDIHRHVTIEARPPREYLKAVADLGAVEADLPPDALCNIISHCLAKDPAGRYRSFAALANDLVALADRLRQGGDIDGMPIDGGSRSPRSPSPASIDEDDVSVIKARTSPLQSMENPNDKLEYLTAAGPFERLNAYNLDLDDGDAARLCPTTLLKHVWESEQSVYCPQEFPGMPNESFYSHRRPRTLMCIPVSTFGNKTGVILLSTTTYTISAAVIEAAKEVVIGVATYGCVAHSQLSFAERLQAGVDQRTRELTATIQAQSQFLSRCSHELRSPLSAIMGLAAVLQASADLSPVQREHVHTITASSEDLMMLISNILDHSKLDSGSVTLEQIPLNVRDIVETALHTIAPLAQSKDIELSLTTPYYKDPPGMIGDPFRVKQILINLLSNAVKFTPTSSVAREQGKGSSKITVKWEWEELDDDRIRVKLDVSDTGMGIPRSKLDKLFKSFSQVDETITRSYGGSGLGLVISRDLARLLGGDCTVESEFGKGSTFTISFVAKKNPDYVPPKWARFPTPQSCFVLCPLDRPWVDLVELNCKPVRFVDDVKSVMRKDQKDGLNAGRRFAFIFIDSVLVDRDTLKRMREVQAEAKFVFLVRVIELSSEMERLGIERESIVARPIKFSSLHASLFPPELSKRPGQTLASQVIGRNGTDRNMGKRHPLTILIVDDAKVNVQVCRRILELFGYLDVDSAEDGEKGIQAAEQKQYEYVAGQSRYHNMSSGLLVSDSSLILLDLQMPVLDGFETLARIRASEAARDPCCVSLSGDVDVATQEKCLDAGFFECLSKPVDIPRLGQVLRKAYDHKKGDGARANTRGNRPTSPGQDHADSTEDEDEAQDS
ncbi:hypothetical protein Q5752_000498 [Cryptotrichosporon argae]